ncbi:MAG TPA: pyruvate kinase [Abditibacteriaceae bacterium]|jgi:pyruvate kinase
MNSSRRAKIICTIGPASRAPGIMRSLILEGMDVARFNFSHGGPNAQAEHIENLRQVARDCGSRVAILQDLQGPKIRTGTIAGGEVELEKGAAFTLTTRPVEGDEKEVSTTYSALPRDCRPNDTILLDDGNIALRVEKVTDTDVICVVTDGGPLKPNKGINLPGVPVSAPALSAKDRHDVEWGFRNNVDFVALSFVRQADEVRELKEMARSLGASTQIIAKLEKPEAMENLDAIIEAADGVMVARGDLGVEMQPEDVPLMQKRIIRAAGEAGKFVITATQMLESMTTNQRPTRAEVSDVANAVLDGTDAVMLSGETANGDYPLDTLKMMARIVEAVEAAPPTPRTPVAPSRDFTDAISLAAARAAENLQARAIVVFTEGGGSALRISRHRPRVPILAFTPHEGVARQLNLVWGVRAHIVPRHDDTDTMLSFADGELVRLGLATSGEIVVFTLGAPVSSRGSTNLLKLHRLGEIHTI